MARSSEVRPYPREAVAVLGHLVRQARSARGWSQQHLGDICTLDRRTIAAIERGGLEVSIGQAFNVAAVLGIRLFDSDPINMSRLERQQGTIAALLPRRVSMASWEEDDDF